MKCSAGTKRERLFTGLRFPCSVATLIIEMMRICPKCGDYYADASLAFCLVDGAPLINVSPLSEKWSEGARVVEGKERELKKQKRKLKWRRVVVSTMAMTTLAVMVLAFNSFISIETTRPEDVTALPSTPETPPIEPVVSITPNTPDETSPTLPTTSAVTGTPTPTPVYKISGRVTTDESKALGGVSITLAGAKSATTTTDANGNYSFKQLLAGGSYTVTPASAKINFLPPSLSINKLTQDKSAHFVGTVHAQSECSEAKESSLIINSCGAIWRQKIEGDESNIIPKYFPDGVVNFRPRIILSEKIGYRITFSKPCQAGVVTASYTRQVIAGTRSTPPQPKEKKLSFVKAGETWRCIAN